MNLTRAQFDILTFLEQEKGKKNLTQRNIAGLTGLSIGTVNKTLIYLNKTNLIEKNIITTNGLNVLEPYRVKRAVFLAAGFGTRLVPITLNTPKPLVRVKGVRIIDTLLDAVCAVGIEEIIIRPFFDNIIGSPTENQQPCCIALSNSVLFPENQCRIGIPSEILSSSKTNIAAFLL